MSPCLVRGACAHGSVDRDQGCRALRAENGRRRPRWDANAPASGTLSAGGSNATLTGRAATGTMVGVIVPPAAISGPVNSMTAAPVVLFAQRSPLLSNAIDVGEANPVGMRRVSNGPTLPLAAICDGW